MTFRIEKLPLNVSKQIANMLMPCDVLNLAMTSCALNKICKFNSDEIWSLFFERFFKSFCTLDDFKIFLEEDMNWKTLCREIFLSNKHNPQFHRLVCSSCLFAVQDSRNCSTAISLKPSKARLNLVQENCLIMDDDESSESSSDSTDEELFQIRQSISDSSLHSEGETESKINLLAPSSSTTTLVDRYMGKVEEIVEEFENQEVNDIQYLTRDDLRKRLQELVNKSIKNFNNDDDDELSLPGNKTKKFSLCYRDGFDA